VNEFAHNTAGGCDFRNRPKPSEQARAKCADTIEAEDLNAFEDRFVCPTSIERLVPQVDRRQNVCRNRKAIVTDAAVDNVPAILATEVDNVVTRLEQVYRQVRRVSRRCSRVVKSATFNLF
jgi:hypothetical protein